jgi:hypothetical protein
MPLTTMRRFRNGGGIATDCRGAARAARWPGRLEAGRGGSWRRGSHRPRRRGLGTARRCRPSSILLRTLWTSSPSWQAISAAETPPGGAAPRSGGSPCRSLSSLRAWRADMAPGGPPQSYRRRPSALAHVRPRHYRRVGTPLLALQVEAVAKRRCPDGWLCCLRIPAVERDRQYRLQRRSERASPNYVVRRAKVQFFSGCNSRPATFAPAGSNRSGKGGNEPAEAFDAKGRLGRPGEQPDRNMRGRRASLETGNPGADLPP